MESNALSPSVCLTRSFAENDSAILEAEDKPEYAVEPMLFGKWSYEGVATHDFSLANYLQVKATRQQVFIPYTAGRYQQRRFKKAQCPIIERVTCMLMTSGHRNNGKKQKAVKIIKQTMELIHILTGENPIQVIVTAISHAGAREDSTRIGSGGVVRRQAVDVSPLRRVNQAIYLIVKAARESAFRSLKAISETLADEIISASKVSDNSLLYLRESLIFVVAFVFIGHLRQLHCREKEGRDRESRQGQQMNERTAEHLRRWILFYRTEEEPMARARTGFFT